MDEVVPWLARGGAVELWCDAVADVGAAGDAEARYRHERSFAGRSGDVAIRVSVQAVAAFDGACPHLAADLRCGAYDARPRTCRIYPAEVVPGRSVDPAAKACPPEAWGERPLAWDGETRVAAAGFRAAHVADQPVRAALAARLGLTRVALRNEGFVVVRPEAAELTAAVESAWGDTAAGPAEWYFASPRDSTRALIGEVGARVEACDAGAGFLALY